MDIYQLKQIETPRLIIRPVQLGDENQISEAIQRSLPDLQRWMPWSKDPGFSTTYEFVKKADQGWRTHAAIEFPMVAIYKDHDLIISATGYNEKSDPSNGIYEIGYWIDHEYKGKGLVTEFVNALTRYALTALHASHVQVTTQEGNHKSIAVVERLGFHKEAVLKEYCIDCVTNEPANSLLYVCRDVNTLPKLEIKLTLKSDYDSCNR